MINFSTQNVIPFLALPLVLSGLMSIRGKWALNPSRAPRSPHGYKPLSVPCFLLAFPEF